MVCNWFFHVYILIHVFLHTVVWTMNLFFLMLYHQRLWYLHQNIKQFFQNSDISLYFLELVLWCWKLELQTCVIWDIIMYAWHILNSAKIPSFVSQLSSLLHVAYEAKFSCNSSNDPTVLLLILLLAYSFVFCINIRS